MFELDPILDLLVRVFGMMGFSFASSAVAIKLVLHIQVNLKEGWEVLVFGAKVVYWLWGCFGRGCCGKV